MIQIRSLVAACATLLFAAAATAADQPNFPRLAGINIGGKHDYDNPAYQAKLAKLDFAILGYWPGWDKSHDMTMEQVVRNIKAINPDAKIFLYENSSAVDDNNATYAPVKAKLDQMGWWVYESGTSGTRMQTDYGEVVSSPIHHANTTLFTPRDSSGYQFWEWHARWVVQNWAKPNPSIAGVFEDTVFWKPRVDADWNRDGTTDAKDSANAGKWLREGFQKRFALLHQLMPGKYVIGNVADWGAKDAVLDEFDQSLDGGVIEGIIGTRYGVEKWGGWQETMRWYRKTMAVMAEPKLVMLDEPAAGINPTLARRLGEHILALKSRGITFLIIEHNMGLVAALCDHVVVLVQGKPFAQGRFADLRSDPRVQEAYMGHRA